MSTPPNEERIRSAAESMRALRNALATVVFGQEAVLDAVITGLFGGGHLLLEGLPGLGKTQLAVALSQALSLQAKRVQFTPDLLPGDITGGPILQEVEGRREFVFQPGPLFSNLVLADEINRASPKTQSALLEAMQERRVSVGGVSHPLPRPFFVIATQNPIELEGTYPLPEAQLDRFLLKIEVKRNSPDVLERIVLGRTLGVDPVVAPVLSRESVAELISLAAALPIPRVVANYIARLVDGSHPGQSKAAEGVRFGASPRAALGLAAGARAHALFQGRGYPSTDDVRAVAHGVLGHRIVLDYSARLEGRSGTSVVEALLSEIDPSPEALPKSLQEIKV